MALQYGFFNALKRDDGTYDRKYNALDYSRNIGAFISTGVRRSQLDDFKPTFTETKNGVKFNAGFAWIEGHWANNDSEYTMNLEAQPVGDNNRQDIIVLRLNTNTADRNITFQYVKGNEIIGVGYPAVKNVIKRASGLYDIALCSITFEKSGTSYNTTLTDLRANSDVCGWVRSPIGYDDYFTSLDNAFNEWFAEKRNTLAITTMFKRYTQHLVVESEAPQIQFSIPQYDPTGVDLIDVYVNGILAVVNVDYTIEGNNLIKFTSNKIAGTEIDIYVYKSIDGQGLGSVSDEITELQNQMATVKNIGEYIYICNGVDDNVKLSQMVQGLFTASDTNKQVIINIYGNFVFGAPVGGNGTNSSRYRWLDISTLGTDNRVILDFAGCGEIEFNNSNSVAILTSWVGIYGNDFIIRNGIFRNTKTTTVSTNYYHTIFRATKSALVENCRFYLYGNAAINDMAAAKWTFNNCYGCLKFGYYSNENEARLFNVVGTLEVNGGEYYIEYGSSLSNGYIFYCNSTVTAGNVLIVNNVSAPQIASITSGRQGQFYKNNVSSENNYAIFNNCITLLTFTRKNEAKEIVNNKIPLSLPIFFK